MKGAISNNAKSRDNIKSSFIAIIVMFVSGCLLRNNIRDVANCERRGTEPQWDRAHGLKGLQYVDNL